MKYQNIINEWFAHLPKGYALPPYTQEEEQVLHQVLQKYNVSRAQLIERVSDVSSAATVDDEQYTMDVDDLREPYRFVIPNNLGVNEAQELEPMSKTDLENLITKFKSPDLKEKYSKYLTVFYYFSPNSLGEISEILLAKLLGGSHTGAAQGLEDLNVDGISISLKTTASGAPIQLGSYKNLVPSTGVLKKLLKLENDNITEFSKLTVSDIINQYENDPDYSDMVSDIKKRINAIAVKLAGESDSEYFVWVEKVYEKSNMLQQINFHVRKFIKSDVIQFLNSCNINPSTSGWSLLRDGLVYVSADNTGKYLNINPRYIISNENVIKVPVLNLNIVLGADAAKKSAKSLDNKLIAGAASDSFFEILDSIYDNFIVKLKSVASQ